MEKRPMRMDQGPERDNREEGDQWGRGQQMSGGRNWRPADDDPPMGRQHRDRGMEHQDHRRDRREDRGDFQRNNRGHDRTMEQRLRVLAERPNSNQQQEERYDL